MRGKWVKIVGIYSWINIKLGKWERNPIQQINLIIGANIYIWQSHLICILEYSKEKLLWKFFRLTILSMKIETKKLKKIKNKNYIVSTNQP